jgi:hypothetical protein
LNWGKDDEEQDRRYLPIYGDMGPKIEMALSAADPACPFLIQHEGKQIFDFEKSWKTACKVARLSRSSLSRFAPNGAYEHDRGWVLREGSDDR